MTSERIIDINYEDEMKQSYIDYSMSVIVQRAIPDVRDGLKPVHRRILYAMHQLRMTHDKPYKKSARIVGEILGKYHPHGDSAVYEAMVRLAQDFRMRNPLIEGQGNFGSIDGDEAAAMRYTEARLQAFSQLLLEDLSKEVVPFQSNFDNSLEEPVVLPTRIPQLLVNGISGVAVGMATEIPPHNLTELLDASLALLDKPNMTTSDLLKYVQGPDFPTGGVITNKEELKELYEKGLGKVRIRSKVKEEKGTHGRTNLVITEIPYTYSGNKTKFIEKFIDLVNDRKTDAITDVRDESNKGDIRIVIELKRGTDIENMKNFLYKVTPLEDNMSCQFLAIVNGKPETLSLKQILEHYLAFQFEIEENKHRDLLKKAKERHEILEGLMTATDSIDTIIEVLRGSKNVTMVRRCLTKGETTGISFRTKRAERQAKKFSFTTKQAQAILDLKLQRLIQLEVTALEKEYEQNKKNMETYEHRLNDKKAMKQYLKRQIRKIRKDHPVKRLTKVTSVETKPFVKKEVVENLYVMIDRLGYMKALDESSAERMEEESLKEYPRQIECLSNDQLAVFTNDGQLLKIPLSKVPKGRARDKGTLYDVLFGDKYRNVLWIGSLTEILQKDWIFLTKNGLIKRTKGKDINGVRMKMLATKLNDDDELVAVLPIQTLNEQEIVLFTDQEQVLRYAVRNLTLLKKMARGVKAISLNNEEKVEAAALIYPTYKQVVVNNKKYALKNIPIKKRGQKGIPLKK